MSLSRRLIWSVAVALAIGGVASAALGAWTTSLEVNYLLDNQLLRIAQLAVHADPRSLQDTPRATRHRRLRVQDNEIVVQRWTGGGSVSLVPTPARLPPPARAGFQDLSVRGVAWRMYGLRTADGWIAAAQPMEGRHELIFGAALTAVLPVLVCLPLVGIFVARVVRRALLPLRRVALDAERRTPMSVQPLDSAGIPLEVQPLVTAFNGLLARMSQGIELERRFVTEAAHALRTPVAALQLQAESLNEARSRTDSAERMADLLKGIARARRTVEQLLDLARSEHGATGRTELIPVLRALAEAFAPLLQQRQVALELQMHDMHGVCVPLVAGATTVLLHNLVDNALRYSPQGAAIRITAQRAGERVILEVIDSGPGIPPSELETVFGRFNRAADDRTPGTGLGLAIVRAIASSVGGRAWLEQSTAGHGLAARIDLPVAAPQCGWGTRIRT